MSEHEFNQATDAAKAAGEASLRNAQEFANSAQSLLDPSKVSETFRSITQKSVEQSKEAYSRLKTAADDATKTLETTLESAHQGSLQLSKKAVDALRNNAEVGFQHLEKLTTAKTFAEIIELQTSYLRKQVELATDQTKDIQSLAQQVAQELLKPGREAFQKASDSAKSFADTNKSY